MSTPIAIDYRVELPAGGTLHLQTPDEVALWEASSAKYKEEYSLSKNNDLIALGQLLLQEVILFRCQTAINGMEVEVGPGGVPTGSYKRVELDAGEMLGYSKTLIEAAKEMRAIEKALGIDKTTREAGGSHTVDGYIKTLKRAAHVRGVHISKRTIEYEKFCNELRVRLRLLYTADEEDRKYHNITPKTVLDWARGELDRLTGVDQKFNREVGKVFTGTL